MKYRSLWRCFDPNQASLLLVKRRWGLGLPPCFTRPAALASRRVWMGGPETLIQSSRTVPPRPPLLDLPTPQTHDLLPPRFRFRSLVPHLLSQRAAPLAPSPRCGSTCRRVVPAAARLGPPPLQGRGGHMVESDKEVVLVVGECDGVRGGREAVFYSSPYHAHAPDPSPTLPRPRSAPTQRRRCRQT